jgi:hypothetical protein
VQVYWKQVDLSNVPQVISSIRKAWLTSLNDNGLEDIIDDLVEFVELETDYHCSLLKVFEISNYFGYNPYANGKEYRLEVTPQVNYHMIPGVYPKSLLQLPILSKQEFQKDPILATFIPSDTGERMYFNCLGCHKSLLLTQKEKDSHVKKCIHY